MFGFILFGGPLSGALVRDVRLANQLSARGYRVHAWWAIDRPRESPLAPEVTEHWLFSGLRYAGFGPRAVGEALGRLSSRMFHDKNRRTAGQSRPGVLKRVMEGLMRQVAAGVELDRGPVERLARDLTRTGVTHLMPMLGVLCPWAQAACRLCRHGPRYLVVFQGYELYIQYARAIECEDAIYARLREAVDASGWPAIAVSDDYLRRVVEDIGVPAESLRAVPPGVPVDVPVEIRGRAREIITAKFGDHYDPDVPIVTYLGRQDTEKGIDLLLYAATILRDRGLRFQLAICGPTLFGSHYKMVCRQLAQDLRCPILRANHISDELRSALFFESRCIVYPSIHREPFGMVAAETLAHGTPAVVPDYGGIAGAIEAEGERGGLHFRVWDSGDLADTIARVLEDDDLHDRLAEAGPRVAAWFSVERLADRVLDHLEIPRTRDRDLESAGRSANREVVPAP
ncbi:MAG: glycosyltransferase family 4 protein [Planctomycetota bacterium]